MKYDTRLLKNQHSILAVAQALGYEVSRNNRVRCLCPENHQHGDAHPSLVLNQKTNGVWCPVCPNTRGDVIEFAKLARKCSFTDAVRFLNDLPVAPPPDQGTQSQTRLFNDRIQKPRPSEFDDVYQCLFDLLSPPTEQAYAWLENRGISRKTADKMHVRWLLKRHQVEEKLKELSPLESLIASGLMGENGTLLLDHHRLIWTYFRNGKPVYFQGRALDAKVQPKEMCLKQAIPCPYNVDILQSKLSAVFVCEGCVDTLTLVEHGLPAVGVVGVNGFKECWLEQFQGMTVRVAYDADLAGQSRAFELVQRFRACGIESEKVYLPDGYDVNRFFLAYRQFCA